MKCEAKLDDTVPSDVRRPAGNWVCGRTALFRMTHRDGRTLLVCRSCRDELDETGWYTEHLEGGEP